MNTPNVARWALVFAGLALPACEIHEASPPPSATIAASPTTTPPSGSTTPAPTATATATATSTAVSTATPAPSGGPLTGEWVSPSCGDRKYPRKIALDDRTGFQAQDLVSPCPKGVTCVWSGIVMRKGKWSSDGKTLKLVVEGNAGSQGAPFPASLELAPGPVERDGAGKACVYQRSAPAAL